MVLVVSGISSASRRHWKMRSITVSGKGEERDSTRSRAISSRALIEYQFGSNGCSH